MHIMSLVTTLSSSSLAYPNGSSSFSSSSSSSYACHVIDLSNVDDDISPPKRISLEPKPILYTAQQLNEKLRPKPKPLRPVVKLYELPPISSNRRFYSAYDASLQDIIWHTVDAFPTFLPTIINRPRWFHPAAVFNRSCPHTKYLHALFLQCPISYWRPISRTMIVQFKTALLGVDPSVAQSIKLLHDYSEQAMDAMCIDFDENNDVDSVDESATITSEDSEGNEVLILFHFWVKANPVYLGRKISTRTRFA